MGSSDPDDGWATASELAEYAFCPRAQWYSRHPPNAPPPARSLQREAAGERFHARTLGMIEQRSGHGARYAAAIVVALLLGLLAFLLIFGVP